ncbi:hypothetical protein FHS61_001038 [Altererythrobacter atlanticus]|uniref:Uncharacterized protein n=1 Tax=Croceibacterium atlanticum TaxID=1267766 RepID=A0A0F7KWT2_9SPHN|nr:hypothetical protein [Croceibacterium atlanticum]AKH43260.1 hypothetical protein WYH_02228 [Croceibacterium atlanticum]MBB5732034.1 hypothetical protein [Croceibacterium atlanticum]
MQSWTIWARALAGAGALAMATAGAAQEKEIPRADGYAELERLPDFGGVWNPDWSLLFGANGRRPTEPELTPPAQAKLDAFRKYQEENGVDQSNQVHCIPPGMPGIMRQPYPIEFLFSPGRVTIFTETYSQARRIYTDGRELPEDPDFLFNGNSVGHWEGDTLIVDSIGFSPLVDIAAGIPHSEEMRIQEKIWLEEPDVLRIETTISDPQVLTKPLVQQLAFKRQPDWDIREYVCAENNRLVSEDGGANIDLKLDEEDDPFGPLPED